MAAFKCTTATDVYSYSHIQTGSLNDEPSSVFISAKDIVKKCFL